MDSNEAILALSNTFKDKKINASVESCQITGPLYRFKVRLAGATKLTKLEDASKEIAMAMRSSTVPIMIPILSEGVVGIDMMFGSHPIVKFEELASRINIEELKPLSILVGSTEIDKPLVLDLAEMPHLLIAGTTGSGKSVMQHAIIKSLSGGLGKRPVRLALLDPKQVEFSRYDELDILDYDVATTAEQATRVMQDIEVRMRARTDKLSKAGCRNIGEYNESSQAQMSYIVVVVDEFADLARAKNSQFGAAILSVAAMGRAAGIHLILGTQHPSREIITGPIKANFPSRIALKVSGHVQSNVVLGYSGAENLVGKGDALLIDGPISLLHFQGAMIAHEKVKPRTPAAKPKSKGFLSKLFS